MAYLWRVSSAVFVCVDNQVDFWRQTVALGSSFGGRRNAPWRRPAADPAALGGLQAPLVPPPPPPPATSPPGHASSATAAPVRVAAAARRSASCACAAGLTAVNNSPGSGSGCDAGLDRQLVAAISLRDNIENVQAAEYPALLQDLVPTIRRLLSEIKPQYMDTSEHVRAGAAVANQSATRSLTLGPAWVVLNLHGAASGSAMPCLKRLTGCRTTSV